MEFVGKGITKKDGWCLMIDVSAENAERIYAEEKHEMHPSMLCVPQCISTRYFLRYKSRDPRLFWPRKGLIHLAKLNSVPARWPEPNAGLARHLGRQHIWLLIFLVLFCI